MDEVGAVELRFEVLSRSPKKTVSPAERPSATATDDELVERICSGSHEALRLLFQRHAPCVFGLGRKILRDKEEAQDLVQEVFWYVFRKCTLFDRAKGSARSWLYQVAYTQAFLRRRHLKSHGLYSSGIEDKTHENEALSRSVADYDESPEGRFGRAVWRRALESLSQDQRQTLRLHFLEGYTFQEIAEKLGQSYANVRNHYYRGLEKLRQHLIPDAANRR